jgi:lipoprotein-anchoring transpeptidase ErfK/SrfK
MRRRFVVVALIAAASSAGGLTLLLGDFLTDGRSAAAPLAASPPQHREGAVPPRVLQLPVCSAGSIVRLDGQNVAYAVTVRKRATAFRIPGARPFARFGRLNVNGVPTVFAVLGVRLDRRCRASWYHVQLPLRPNGVTGWVRASVVSQRALHVRIVVDLSQRQVALFRAAKLLLVTTAAIGSPATPTPTGHYFVNQKLVAPDPLGPFGPAALGISAFSPVLQNWVQGGPIAIHGTNQAELLGSAVSHGCIRVPNDVVEKLWKLVPTGTPVLIRM